MVGAGSYCTSSVGASYCRGSLDCLSVQGLWVTPPWFDGLSSRAGSPFGDDPVMALIYALPQALRKKKALFSFL